MDGGGRPGAHAAGCLNLDLQLSFHRRGMKITPEARFDEGLLDLLVVSPGIVAYADGGRMGPLPVTIRVDPGALQLW